MLFASAAQVGKVLYQMLVVQAFRADRLLARAGRFVATVMGESFRHVAEQELDLATIVLKEVSLEDPRTLSLSPSLTSNQ